MPIYKLYCEKCGAETEKVLPMAERNNQKCRKCGNELKVQISTTNVLSRGIPLRTRDWMRKRDL